MVNGQPIICHVSFFLFAFDVPKKEFDRENVMMCIGACVLLQEKTRIETEVATLNQKNETLENEKVKLAIVSNFWRSIFSFNFNGKRKRYFPAFS